MIFGVCCNLVGILYWCTWLACIDDTSHVDRLLGDRTRPLSERLRSDRSQIENGVDLPDELLN